MHNLVLLLLKPHGKMKVPRVIPCFLLGKVKKLLVSRPRPPPFCLPAPSFYYLLFLYISKDLLGACEIAW